MGQEEFSWLLWASLAAMSLLYYLLVIRSGSRRLPPGPRPLPLIGNLLDLRGNLHHALARLAQAHGPVMHLKLGFTTMVVVSSRDTLREAFAKHDKRLAARNVPDAARVLSDVAMLYQPSSDPQWKTMRGLVASHVVSPRSLAATRGVREGKVRDLVRHLRGRAGREVEVAQAVFGGVINLISGTFFSADAVEIGDASAHGLHQQVEVLMDSITRPNVSDLFPFLGRLDLQGIRREASGYLENVFRILDRIVERRLAEKASAATEDNNKHDDFLDTLLGLMSTGKIDRNTMRASMLELFVAGSDTTASTVSWTMAELLHNPSVMAKVREEIKATFGGKEAIEEPETARLPYLQAVVKEAMRLHPVAPLLLPHKAVEDGVEIGGYVVPKGSTVLFNTWAIMRDKTLWERPEEFVPERFMDAAREQVDFRGSKELDFLPFGTGRRQCPGLPFAERVVPHVVASLLHAFEWRLPDGVSPDQLDLSERFTTVNYLATPLKAVPIVISY